MSVGRCDDAAPDATWLKELHAKFTGFSYGDGKIRSISYDREFRNDKDGKLIDTEHETRVGLVYRIDDTYTDEKLPNFRGFTGNVFWYSDENGETSRVVGQTAALEVAQDLIDTDAITTLPWQYERTESFEGKSLAVVRVTLKTGLPITLDIDRDTGAYARVTVDADGAYQTTYLLTYGEIAPGLKMPLTIRADGNDGEYFVKNVSLNPAVSDAMLHPPQQTAHWDFAPESSLPLSLTKYRVVVHAIVNGVPGTFLMDTGAQITVLSGEFARRAKLQAVGHSEIASLYGTNKTDIGKIDTLQIGQSVLHDVIVNYGTASVDDDAPDGLLGYSVWANAVVKLDFKNKTFGLLDPSAVDPQQEPGEHLAIDLSSGQPTTAVQIGNTLMVNGIVDTGNPEDVVIPNSMIAGYGLHFANVGDGCGTLDDIHIGTGIDRSPMACVDYGGGGRWVLLGLDYLKRFDSVEFDYAHGMLDLTGEHP